MEAFKNMELFSSDTCVLEEVIDNLNDKFWFQNSNFHMRVDQKHRNITKYNFWNTK